MNNFVKTAFVLVGCSTLAILLYINLFGMGKFEGAVKIACRNAEQPIARYYDVFGKQPTELWDNLDGKPNGEDLFQRSNKEGNYHVSY